MRNRRVDNRRLAGAPDLRQVREQTSKILFKPSRGISASVLGRTSDEPGMALTRKRLLRVSRRWRSTALCVARRSAVLARRLGLRFAAAAAAAAAFEDCSEPADIELTTASGIMGWSAVEGVSGVRGSVGESTEEGEAVLEVGEPGMVGAMDMSIVL